MSGSTASCSLTSNIIRLNFRFWGGLLLGISVQFFSSSEKEAEGSMTISLASDGC